MSFRKRSVRPNLSSSKRTITEEKVDTTKEKDLTEANVDSPDSSKVQENGVNEETVATTGKRLSKRAKIIPKLNQKKTTNDNVTATNLSSEEIKQADPACNKDAETEDFALTDKTKDSPLADKTDVTPCADEIEVTPLPDSHTNSADCSESVDVLSVYKMISAQSNVGMNENKADTVTGPPENINKEKRIPKRTKVAPKLAPRSVNRESINNTSTNEKTESVQENCKASIEADKYTEVMDKSDNIHTTSLTNDASPNTNKSVRLQKRMKVQPKLTLRTTKANINIVENNEEKQSIIDNNQQIVENQQDELYSNNSRTSAINSCLKSPQKGEIISDENSQNYNETYNNSHEVTSPNKNNSPLPSDKKESKQVRFRNEDLEKNECIENSEENNKLVNCNNDEEGVKSPTPSVNKNVRYDSNDDYDSLSEGESLGRQLSSKNKVFKPNLGTKRRERLSSFSAYSSCDEDDWQSTKKKKKEKKPSDDKKGNETQAKDGKKKKPKSSTKQKKNRENMEPNAEEVPKKRKKREPKPKKANKFHEERDLSSLTMQELIHYHPPSFKTVELRSKRDEDENERVIDMGSVPLTPADKKPEPDQKRNGDEIMAPQIMINEDGEIVINQDSLTISQKVDDSSLKNSAVVYEDSLTYGSHLKRKHVVGKRWKIEETLRFYKALSEIGTDFTLMSQAFGRFSRNELKKKFKKEEKVNCDLVDRALSNRLPLNMEMFLRGKEEMKEYADENDNKIKVSESFCNDSTPNSPTDTAEPAEPGSSPKNNESEPIECSEEVVVAS